MIGVAQIHCEVVPNAVLKDAHIPGAGDRVRKLPDNVVTVFVGKAFVVRLNDGFSALPECRAQGVQRVAAFLRLRSLQVLKCVDRFDFGQIFRKPLNTGFRLATLEFFDEFRDFVLTD